MREHRIRMPGAALLALLVALPGCATMGGVLAGRPDDLYGQVRAVDARRGYLQIQEDYGRDYTVRFDGRTRVVYGGRDYSVGSLRRGDEVRVELGYDRGEQPWAERIELRRSASGNGDIWRSGGGVYDRGGIYGRGTARVERWDGRVRQVDYRRGWFTIERGRYNDERVYVGRFARNEDIRRFERLRPGQRVKVEVRTSYAGGAELVRFR